MAARCQRILLLGAICALWGCSGPRMYRLDSTVYPRRPSIYPIDVYQGEILQAHREIAIIESSAFPDDDDETRVRQLEELRKKARKPGGDDIEQVRILTKQVKGYTIDERTPFPSWKQGIYPLYFMRGTVIIYESSLPGAVATGSGFQSAEED